jgi:hypothetical protein
MVEIDIQPDELVLKTLAAPTIGRPLRHAQALLTTASSPTTSPKRPPIPWRSRSVQRCAAIAGAKRPLAGKKPMAVDIRVS